VSNLYVGWDVGGWNCDRNRTSRDAVCAIAGDLENLELVGIPWRGAIRAQLLNADGRPDFLLNLLEIHETFEHIVVAIDTPLGWPVSLQGLITSANQNVAVPDEPGLNPFLFRGTERALNQAGIATLSAVRDQIGSQSTKGQTFLTSLGFERSQNRVGEWRKGIWTAIETYPAPCYHSPLETCYAERLRRQDRFLTATRAGAWVNVASDLADAVMCAVVAAVFHEDPSQLRGPTSEQKADAAREGWIWTPTEVDVAALQNERRGLGEENL